MSRFDHTAIVNSRRRERSLGHHALRAYAQERGRFFNEPESLLRRTGMIPVL